MKSKGISAKSSASRSKESIRTWLRLLSCKTVIEQRLRAHFRNNFPVTLPQFDVLAELQRAAGPLTMSQLSNELMVSNGNVTGVIDRLEKIGFVKRSRTKRDRRVQYIQLTATGRKEFDWMASRHERWLEQYFSNVTLADMRKLQNLLLKTRDSVSAFSE